MKSLFYLALIGAVAYGIIHYVPAETRQRAVAAVGLSGFFEETLPSFLRSKLSIPENPVVKRERLLGELSAAIGGVASELGAIDSQTISLAPPAERTPAKSKNPAPLLTSQDIRQRLEKTKELLTESEAVLGELKQANPQQGFIAQTAERLLDKILPPTESNRDSAGVGGDAAGATLCLE
ncbi:MAG: hypothetical protein HY474_01210 [Candidatus Sungbacteria bacterium]|uniref:Uncharacterized protein n=1 Tax=Candidatus Sungiibacteriota bacterium TaxID=2750080 RepID=A0A932YWK4_9BACT|nr:hypothetical protein [Candidatus Sungbacteria bacterium]